METFRAIGRRNLIILALSLILVAICFALSRWVFEHGTNAHAFTDFFSVVGAAILVSLSALWLIRRRLGSMSHRPSNDVMGFVYATIGVIYGVILGFVVVTVWQEFENASRRSDQEALTVANLIRLSPGLPGDAEAKSQQTLMSYLDVVINDEFPKMANGAQIDDDGIEQINELWNIYAQSQAEGDGKAYYEEGLDQLTQLGTLRRERLLSASEALPSIFWIVLISGGALTVGFAGAFAVESWTLHAWMVALLAALISVLLLLVVELNHPYRGDIRVSDHSYRFVQDQFANGYDATSGYVIPASAEDRAPSAE